LNEEIRDDRSEREKNRRQLSKQRKPPLDALEHRARREETQAGEAEKAGQVDIGFWVYRVWTPRFQPKAVDEGL
jgi:hypothetical protein